jgi:small subunit ribosomal protein S16
MRLGKKRAPYYRIIVADSRTKREGRVIETIGKYHPKEDPSVIEVDSERAQYWLKVGAQPTEPVAAILKVTGDWQKFRGEPAPEPMKTRAERPDKKALFAAAAKQAAGESEAAATTPRKKAAPKAAKAEAPAEASAEAPTAESPAAPPDAASAADAPAAAAAAEAQTPANPPSAETAPEVATEAASAPAAEAAGADTSETATEQ